MENNKNLLKNYEKEINDLINAAKECGEKFSREEAEQIILNRIVHENKSRKFKEPVLKGIEQNQKLLALLSKQLEEIMSLLKEDNDYISMYKDYLNESISKIKSLIKSLKDLEFSIDDMVIEINN